MTQETMADYPPPAARRPKLRRPKNTTAAGPVWRSPHVQSAMLLALFVVVLFAEPAFAQNLESKVQNLGNLVINILTVVAVVVGTAACLLAGMKYFSGDPHAREQVKGIAIGAFFCFAAVPIVQAMKSVLG